MPSALLSVIKRRQRQREVLRRMLGDVDTLLRIIDELSGDRTLTPDEELEKESLENRRDRIDKSISELESSDPREGVSRA